jgi:uncharacterized protein (TIGR03083 family)
MNLDGDATVQERARAALRAAGQRVAGLLAGAGDDLDRPVPGSEWTVGQVAAHLLVGLRGYTAAARDEIGPEWTRHIPDTPLYSGRVSALTARTLQEEPRRDAATLVRLVGEGIETFLAATGTQPADKPLPMPWYAEGATLPVLDATCLLLGEQIFHGYDMARALGQPWRIDQADACLIFPAVTKMMPLALDPEAARGAALACDIRLRGPQGPRAVLTVKNGSATVEPWASQPVDCHLSADPAAFLLVGYGRINQWQAIARGQMVAWGRKPWRALRLRGYFFNP